MPNTEPVATNTRLIAAGVAERALNSAVAQEFPDLTPAAIFATSQEETGAAERRSVTARY